MARVIPLKEFVSPRFLREIHHLLWLEGDALVDGTVDAGWNCRDHALVVALLMRMFGHGALLAHGAAVFVRGGSGRMAPVTVSQLPHSWILVDGVGAVDVSIKPEFDSGGQRFRLGLDAVFANRWLPGGKGEVRFVNDEAVFAAAVRALPQRDRHATAVYLVREAEHVHDGHLRYSAGWIRSPLTRWLETALGDPVALYAALVLHLRAFLLHETPSLAGKPGSIGWRALAARAPEALDCALRTIAEGGWPASAAPDYGAVADAKRA